MALIYVRSTTGNNGNSGADWANAKATLAGADAIDVAGDTIYVSQVHAEVTAGTVTLAFAGTLAAPTKIICVDDSANPPTAVAVTATAIGNTGFNIFGGSLYCYGISFTAGATTNSSVLNVGNSNAHQTYELCQFLIGGTGSTGSIRTGNSGGVQQSVTLIDCNIKFLNVANVFTTAAKLHWKGGGVVSGSTSPTVLFQHLQQCGEILCENVDFSNFGSAFDLTSPPLTDAVTVIRYCQLPASWSGDLLNSAFIQTGRTEMHNCASSSTNYRFWIEDFLGSVRDETTIVRAGGASDGVTQISWKLASSANTLFPWAALATQQVAYDNIAIGSPVTVTAQFIHDSVTDMTNGEICLEVNYLGGSTPLGTLITDLKADILVAASNHASSSAIWTTTGLTNPNEQKLSVTFTPNMIGRYLMRVVLYKASKTVYVCPKFEFS